MTGDIASAREASRSQAGALSPPRPLLHTQKWVAPLWQAPKVPPILTEQVHQERASNQLYLIHRNKHREDAKLRRQRNMAQLKEQNKTVEKQLNKTEIANL